MAAEITPSRGRAPLPAVCCWWERSKRVAAPYSLIDLKTHMHKAGIALA